MNAGRSYKLSEFLLLQKGVESTDNPIGGAANVPISQMIRTIYGHDISVGRDRFACCVTIKRQHHPLKFIA